uniref:FZ domain-containing protein n=1 Tax=Anguilla anguilla TaxID=7936 RepID=A0A0E9S2W7_ANGAN
MTHCKQPHMLSLWLSVINLLEAVPFRGPFQNTCDMQPNTCEPLSISV